MERMDLADAPWRLWHCMALHGVAGTAALLS